MLTFRKKGAITVSNIVGNQVLLQAYPAGTNQINIDIDSFAPGVYIVTYTKDGKIGTKLFIKN